MSDYKFDFKAEMKEKYADFQDLRQKEEDLEESEDDSEDDYVSYDSKCATMEILESMQYDLMNSIDSKDREENEVIIDTMLAIVRFHQGTIKLELDALGLPNKKDEFKAGEEYLTDSISLLNKHGIQSITVIPTISVLHEICAFWSMKNDGNKAMKYLEQAKNHYKYFKLQSFSEPVSLSCIFGISNPEESPGEKLLEELHTDTFYYLTQVYGILENYVTSAVCCYIAMKRYVEMKDATNIFWVLGFWVDKTYEVTEEDDFNLSQTKLCLAAATYILEKFEIFFKELSEKIEKNDIEQLVLDQLWENFKIAKAKISGNWASYGLELMSRSQNHLMSKVQDEESKLTSDKSDMEKLSDTTLYEEYLSDTSFETIQNDIGHIANGITDKYLLNFNDAKEVFLKILKWSSDSKYFFTFREHLVDFINININISESYKILIFYEKDKSRQAKMHKRRIDILEDTIKDLNLKDHEVECRQLWTELGDAYAQILKIKLEVLETKDEISTSDESVAKINRLAKSAILNYTKFIDSLKNLKEYPEHLLEGNLYAYSQIGKLYNKFITQDKRVQLANLRQSLQACNFVVEFCQKNPKAANLVPECILNTCKDFTKLLPIKMNKLIEEISAS